MTAWTKMPPAFAWRWKRVLPILGSTALLFGSLVTATSADEVIVATRPAFPALPFGKDLDDDRARAVKQFGSLAKAVEGYGQRLMTRDNETRKNAAFALGCLGAEESLPYLKNALAKPAGDKLAEGVALSAIEGLQRALGKGLLSPGLKTGCLDAVAPLFDQPFVSDAQHIFEFALALDQKRALALMIQPPCWRKDNPVLGDLLYVLTLTDLRVPVEKLRELAPSLPNGEGEDAWRVYGHFLNCYAMTAPVEAEPLIRAALKMNPWQKAGSFSQDRLAEALCSSKGLKDFYSAGVDRMHKNGFQSLSKVEQTFMAVRLFGYEMDSDGESNFFNGLAHETWNALRAGFVELNLPKHVKLLDDWAKVFEGPKPGEKGFDFTVASEKYEAKTGKLLIEQIERITNEDKTEGEDLDTTIQIWAAEHAAELKKAAAEAKK